MGLSIARGGSLIHWFADLPIERKLRVGIMVPAMAAFGIAMMLHLATNLLHVRQDMRERATRIGRVEGAGAIEALSSDDAVGAISALSALRDEPTVNRAPSFTSPTSYTRAPGNIRFAPGSSGPHWSRDRGGGDLRWGDLNGRLPEALPLVARKVHRAILPLVLWSISIR